MGVVLKSKLLLLCILLLSGIPSIGVLSAGYADEKIFNIMAFGAKGDGVTDNTTCVNRAIEACARQGGGTVIIPKGEFLTGSVILRSRVNLRLEKDAVLRGIARLDAYHSISDMNNEDTYYKVKPRNWNKALLLGDKVHDIVIEGEGILDGGHLEDKEGEEGMRGPHILFLSRSANIMITGVKFRGASNYAFMSYDIEQVTFSDLLIEEGWDGIHIRGGKDICIRNCRFYTGDDAIAGGLWQNMIIEDCYLNSSCNGLRVIMPVSDLRVVRCRFQGPGKFAHRTSREKMRKNMLTGVLVQPGAWFPAPGKVEEVTVRDCTFDNLGNPFLFTLNEGNQGSRVRLERLEGTRLLHSAASVESWSDSSYRDVRLSDVSLAYVGGNETEPADMIPSKPYTDYRMLPCWGLYLRKVDQVVLQDIRLFSGKEGRYPAFRLDEVNALKLEKIKF